MRHTSPTWEANIGGSLLTVAVTEGKNGQPLRVAARYGKVGNPLQAMLDVTLEAMSMGLAKGVPLAEYVHTFSARRFAPKGPTGDELVPECSSLIDYVVRSVAARYLGLAHEERHESKEAS
jgi:ribonucleoside-diphosphate reductase alpha chain